MPLLAAGNPPQFDMIEQVFPPCQVRHSQERAIRLAVASCVGGPLGLQATLQPLLGFVADMTLLVGGEPFGQGRAPLALHPGVEQQGRASPDEQADHDDEHPRHHPKPTRLSRHLRPALDRQPFPRPLEVPVVDVVADKSPARPKGSYPR